MRIAQVHFTAKPDCIEAFKAAATENARNSLQEEGVLRFDILQADEDPTAFILFEVYRSASAQADHRQTPHFSKWRSDIQNLVVEPGKAVIFTNVFPGDDSWE